MIPEKNAGFFISYNSVGGGGSPRAHLAYALLDRYFPADSPENNPAAGDEKRIRSCAGNYRPTRVVKTNWAKLMALMMNVNIKVTEDGRLYGAGKQWVEVEPFIFEEIGGNDKLVFEEDEDGNIANLFIDSSNLVYLCFYVFDYFIFCMCKVKITCRCGFDSLCRCWCQLSFQS